MPVGDPKGGEWWWMMDDQGRKVSCLVEAVDGSMIVGRAGLYDDWEQSVICQSWFLVSFLDKFIHDIDHKVKKTEVWRLL